MFDYFSYQNRYKIYDVDSFVLRDKKLKEGAYLVIKERKIQKYITKFFINVCIMIMIITPFIIYKLDGFDNFFLAKLVVIELFYFVILYFLIKKNRV